MKSFLEILIKILEIFLRNLEISDKKPKDFEI